MLSMHTYDLNVIYAEVLAVVNPFELIVRFIRAQRQSLGSMINEKGSALLLCIKTVLTFIIKTRINPIMSFLPNFIF